MTTHDTQSRLCLIGGTGRCGTTILKRIFQAHPQVAKIPEWRFAVDPDGLLDFYTTFKHHWSPHLFDVRLKRLHRLLIDTGKPNFINKYFRLILRRLHIEQKLPFKAVPRYSDISITPYAHNYLSFVNTLIDTLSQFKFQGTWIGSTQFEKNVIYHHSNFNVNDLQSIFSDFLNQLIQDVLQLQKADYLVEDNTWNILWFDQILELMPETKLVHIYRDPRDVVASFVKMVWAPSDPEQAALFYQDIVNEWWNVRAKVPEKSFYEIALETLVENPEKTLRSLCEFWEIPWHDALLSIDLSRSHAGRYKKDFSPSEINAIETILEEPLKKMGYNS